MCIRDRSPTAYFLGKVCLARSLEPKIPEECLVTKFSYHYEEGIARARLCGQIKTIQSMAALLENYEHENYYCRSRQRNYYQLRDRNNTANNNNQSNSGNRDNRSHVNYVRSTNREGNRGYRRPNYQGRRSLELNRPYPNSNKDNGYNKDNYNRNYSRKRSSEDNREQIIIIQWGTPVRKDTIQITMMFTITMTLGTVSYTHLDVYKRQVFRSYTFRRWN